MCCLLLFVETFVLDYKGIRIHFVIPDMLRILLLFHLKVNLTLFVIYIVSNNMFELHFYGFRMDKNIQLI